MFFSIWYLLINNLYFPYKVSEWVPYAIYTILSIILEEQVPHSIDFLFNFKFKSLNFSPIYLFLQNIKNPLEVSQFFSSEVIYPKMQMIITRSITTSLSLDVKKKKKSKRSGKKTHHDERINNLICILSFVYNST